MFSLLGRNYLIYILKNSEKFKFFSSQHWNKNFIMMKILHWIFYSFLLYQEITFPFKIRFTFTGANTTIIKYKKKSRIQSLVPVRITPEILASIQTTEYKETFHIHSQVQHDSSDNWVSSQDNRILKTVPQLQALIPYLVG